MRCIAIVSLLFLLGSCVPAPPTAVEVHTDAFSPKIELDGPKHSESAYTTFYEWQLVSLVDKKTPDVTYALFFDTAFMGHVDPLMKAFDDTAQPMPILPLHIDKGTCYHHECSLVEKAYVVLQDVYLRKHAAEGFRIKITTRDGLDYILPVTPAMIRLQLETTEKYAHRQ